VIPRTAILSDVLRAAANTQRLQRRHQGMCAATEVWLCHPEAVLR
jgi:hypothetical protein